jgi:hypothetical protein
MNNDVELIVTTGGIESIASISNNPSLMGIGVLSRYVATSTPAVDAMTIGTVVTIRNAAGQSVVKTLQDAPILDSPVPGQTRLNFAGSWAQDYSAAAGGYFLLGATASHSLELYLNETISQNWRFSDLQTFEALGSFSREFRIPATQSNCEAIGYLTDVNIDPDTNYLQVKLPAELRVQTLPIASGYIRVMRVITQAGKLADFEVTFYAESPDLFNKISGKKLKDIEALADLNVVLDYDEVLAASGYPYLYSLTDYGQKWDQTGALGSRSIYDETVTGCVRAGDLTPSLCWQWIFEKIITEAGFTYTASNLETALYRYYAPWINSKSLQFEVSADSALFRYYLSSNQSLLYTYVGLTPITEQFDNGSNLLSTVYTAPTDGVYYFRIWFTGFINAFGGVLIRGNNLTTGTIITLYQQGNFLNAPTHYDSANSLFGIQLSAGDQFEIQWRASGGASSIDLYAGSSYDTGTGVELYMVDIRDVATLNWSANSPDVSQADFLRDVLNMHCCVLIPDRTIPNNLVIEPIKNYIGSGSDRDWSKKLDISKDIVLSNTSDFQNKRLTFTYSEGEDAGSKIYSEVGRIYGDYKIENYTVSEDDVPNDFARDSEQKVQLTTQSTPCNYIRGTSIVIPKFISSDEGNFVNPKLRCLFYAGDVEMTLWNSAGNFPDPTYVAPILNHYEFIQPLFSSLDLNWAPEVPLYIQGINPVNNLFNVYWRDYLNQLYSPSARIMECYLALDLSDILNFTFADRIWIGTAWWRILEISDYKVGSSEVTKVTLLKLVDAVPETSVVPVDTTPGGVVLFENRSGASAPGTQSACERFGYTWDPITNSCYAFTSQPQNTQIAIGAKSVGISTRQISNADSTIVMADKLNNDPLNIYTVAVGADITIEANNQQSVAIGERLTKQGEGGVVMYGKNVLTSMPGIHYGGGYRGGDPASTYVGWAQSGIIVLQDEASILASGDIMELFVDGVPGTYLTLPPDAVWSCLLNYTVQDKTLAGNYETGQLSFALVNVASTASASPVVVINTNGGFGGYVFTFDVDVVTDPAQPRVTVQVTGGTFSATFVVTASLYYQQSQIN